jgi:hypothetical protein
VVTKTLEKLVLPVLEAAPFAYGVYKSGNTVSFDVKLPRFTSRWRVVDHTRSQVLAIEVQNIVMFGPDATGALVRANERSNECFGKFSLVKSPISLSPELGYLLCRERLTYCLELPYIEDTTPAAFHHALFLAFDTVATNYEGWRNMSDGHKEKGLYDRIKDAFG